MSTSRVMKDSALGWLGLIPEDWELKPFFTVCSELNFKNKGMKESNLLSLSYGNIVLKDIDSNDGLLPESFEGYQIIEPDDLVFRFTDLQNDQRSLRSAISQHRGIITSAYLAVRPFGVIPKYLAYLMRAYDQIKVFYSMGGGLRQAMNFQDVKRLLVPKPPIQEQQAIVEYLDRETLQIDALIEKQKQLIQVLDERSRAVISIAVTRGLDSAVQFKDSGVERIGKIPKHWTAQTFRRIGQLESGADYKEFEVEDGGYPVIGSGGEFRRVSKYMFEGESVLFGRKGTIDKPLYVNCAFWTVDTMYWTRLNSEVVAKFIYYWATTLPFKQFTTNTALPSMTSADIKDFEIALPPKDEQLQISEYLDQVSGAINALTLKAQAMIEVLTERRQAIISAAVSGKIDVRGN